MKFGVLYEVQRPTLDDNKAIEETIEQCMLADEMGWDYVWFVEHHFLTGFSMSPCPEVILAALSRVTKRIRLGFGVMILPYHHPVRAAERVAMIDHLSGGRLDFGTGRSAPYEQTGMGIDPRNTRAMWAESLEMIPKIWDSEHFEYEGQFWNVPSREVLPKPYQDPHPPIWVAALQPDTYELAAEKGIGVLALSFTAPELLVPHIKAYRENVKNAKPVGKFINNNWLSLSQACCDEDDLAAKEKAALSLKTFIGPDKPYLQGQVDVYKTLLDQWGGIPDHLKEDFYRSTGKGAAFGGAVDTSQLEKPDEVDESGGGALAEWAWKEIDGKTLAERGVVVGGDPESCIKSAKLYQDTGIDQLGLQVATEILDHNAAMKTIEMFGKYVIPEFKKAEAKAGAR